MKDTTCLCDYRWDFGAQAELLSVGRAMAKMLGIIKPQPNPPSQGRYGSETSPPLRRARTQAHMHRGTERNFQKACNRTKHSFYYRKIFMDRHP